MSRARIDAGKRAVEHDPELELGVEPIRLRRATDVSGRDEPGEERARRGRSPTSSAAFGASGARQRRDASCAALPGLAGQLEEDLLERRPLDASARGGRCRAPPRSRRPARAARRPRGGRRPMRARSTSASASSDASRVGVRGATDRRTRSHRLDLGHRRLPDEPAAMDDHDLVDGLRDLREDVARDQDRPPLARERAEEVAKPADALRVEAVRRLVEDEHLGVAEKRRREAESLPHPERVALHAPPARTRPGRRARAPRRPAISGCPRRARARGGGSGPSAPDARRRSRAARRRAARARRARGTACPRTVVLPGGRPDEPENRAHRRRLAGAVRAEEARDRPGLRPRRRDRRRRASSRTAW